MNIPPRTLLVGGVSLLVLSALFSLTLRATYGQRSAYINVRWAPSVDEATRHSVEQRYSLEPVEFREQRTWAYYLNDVSRNNIRALVRDPAVEDTHHIDRARFRLSDAERGNYRTDKPAWIADLLEFGIDAALFAGAAAILLGAFNAWRARRTPAPSPAAA